jgi:hypothetical protein
MGAELSMTVDFDPHTAAMDRIIDSWLPLTFAVNSINRSMGLSDLYPFVLAPPVIVKLSFIHKRIHAARGGKVEDPDDVVGEHAAKVFQSLKVTITGATGMAR